MRPAPDAVTDALRAAWSGVDPGPPAAARPSPVLDRTVLEAIGPRRALARHPDTGIGGVLDLSLAADPTRTVGGVALRRVPSAGGRYPVDAYLADERGVIAAYDPLAHAVYGEPVAAGPVRVVLALTPRRTIWRYGPRSLPVLLLDLGHAVAALLAAAAVCGRPARARFGPEPGCEPASRFALAVVELDRPVPGRSGSDGPAPNRSGPGVWPVGRSFDPGEEHDPVVAALAQIVRCRTPGRVIDASGFAPAATLRARRSAGWAALTGSGPVEVFDPVLKAARRHGVDAHLLHRGTSPALLDAFAGRSCGQPGVADAAALLVVTGRAEATNRSVPELVDAGAAVHDAWLVATAAGLPARPVGCWIDAVLDGPHGRRRVLHALALGCGTCPDRNVTHRC